MCRICLYSKIELLSLLNRCCILHHTNNGSNLYHSFSNQSHTLLLLTLLWDQAGTLAEKPSGTQRSWWIRDLFNTGRLKGDHFSKDLSTECKWEGSFIVVSFHICAGFQVHSKQRKKNLEEGSLSKRPEFVLAPSAILEVLYSLLQHSPFDAF